MAALNSRSHPAAASVEQQACREWSGSSGVQMGAGGDRAQLVFCWNCGTKKESNVLVVIDCFFIFQILMNESSILEKIWPAQKNVDIVLTVLIRRNMRIAL